MPLRPAFGNHTRGAWPGNAHTSGQHATCCLSFRRRQRCQLGGRRRGRRRRRPHAETQPNLHTGNNLNPPWPCRLHQHARVQSHPFLPRRTKTKTSLPVHTCAKKKRPAHLGAHNTLHACTDNRLHLLALPRRSQHWRGTRWCGSLRGTLQITTTVHAGPAAETNVRIRHNCATCGRAAALLGALRRRLFLNWRRSAHCGGGNQQMHVRQTGRPERSRGSQTQLPKTWRAAVQTETHADAHGRLNG